MYRTRVGKLLRAVANDPWMAGTLGINVPAVLTVSVLTSFVLAGLAGGLLLPNQTLSIEVGSSYLLYSFLAVVIGGLGSTRGTFVACVLLGIVESANATFMAQFGGIAIYVLLAAFLVWRPQRPRSDGRGDPVSGIPAERDVAVIGRRRSAWRLLPAAGIGILAVLLIVAPHLLNPGLLFILGLTLIQAVFALSWNLLFGYTGLASFGHAGFFAVGAYCTGAMLRYQPSVPFMLVLVLSAALGALVAYGIGVVALRRLAGIFLAVLTVALTEVLGRVIGYSTALGEQDGLGNIPRPHIGLLLFDVDLSSGPAYYWFLLLACSCITALLWLVVHSRTGRIFLAIKQDAERSAFIGIDVQYYRLLSFMISGAVASLAGGLFAPWTRIVTLDQVTWLASTQPILNTLLGGASFFWGPVVGSVVFALITYWTRTFVGLSEIIVGGTLMLVIIAAPTGIVGLLHSLGQRLGWSAER